MSLSNSLIGYKNLLEDAGGTVTASSEATGFEKENCFDWRPFTWWKPTATGDSWVKIDLGSAKTADYFAVAAHDLSTQGSTIKLQWSSNDSTWNDATTATGGTSDRVIFKIFASQSARYWRILANNPSTIAAIGIVAFGDQTDLTKGQKTGFAPSVLNPKSEMLTSESNTGLFLGRSIERTGYPGSIKIDNLTPAFVRDTWDPFIVHAELKPFFFSWDTSTFDDEGVLAWMNNRPSARYISELYMAVSLEFNANR